MTKPCKTIVSRPRPQFRLGSLMTFTTGLCAVSAVLAALDVHPMHVLIAGVLFSIGVAVLAVQLELTYIACGTRDRQRHEANPRRD